MTGNSTSPEYAMSRDTYQGAISVTKMNGVEDSVAVSLRLNDQTVVASMSLEEFSAVLFGRAETPCTITARKGKHHGMKE